MGAEFLSHLAEGEPGEFCIASAEIPQTLQVPGQQIPGQFPPPGLRSAAGAAAVGSVWIPAPQCELSTSSRGCTVGGEPQAREGRLDVQEGLG